MTRPGKIVCIGRNYQAHAKELGNEVPTEPMVFYKPSSSVIAGGESIVLPRDAGRVDYEGEIGIVIGKALRHANVDTAKASVRGIVALNDVSARDLQLSDKQWWRAKGSDTFCPIGPERTGTPDFDDLTVITRVNGQERQRGHTGEMAFPILDVLVFVSRFVTLEPGDVVAMGTPAGVAALKPGDVVEVEVPGWSAVRNPVVAEA